MEINIEIYSYVEYIRDSLPRSHLYHGGEWKHYGHWTKLEKMLLNVETTMVATETKTEKVFFSFLRLLTLIL